MVDNDELRAKKPDWYREAEQLDDRQRAEYFAQLNELPPSGPRYPVIQLKQLQIPALVVPIIFCIAFLIYRIYGRRFIQARLRAIVRLAKEESDEKNLDRRGDFVTNPSEKSPVDEETQVKADVPEPGPMQLLRLFIQAYGLNHLNISCLLNSLSSEFLTVTCIAEIAVLLTIGFFMMREMLPTYAAQALAWALFLIQHLTGVPHSFPVSFTIIGLAMLTICTFPTKFDRVSSVPWFGSSTLILLVAQGQIPAHHPIRGLYLSKFECWQQALFLLLITIGSIAWRMRNSPGIATLAGAARDEGSAATLRLLRIIGPSIIFVVLNVMVSYATSCMGFRWLLDDKLATPPSFRGGGSTGGIIMFCAFIMLNFMDQIRDPKGDKLEEKESTTESAILNLVDLFINLAGWTVLGLLSLSLLLMGMKELLGLGFYFEKM